MRSLGVFSALLIGATGGAASAEFPPGHFGWLAELAGSCWQGTYPDGETTDTQCYSSQYGRYLRGTIAIRPRAAGGKSYEGDSVFAWDPKAPELDFHYWSSEGSNGVSRGVVAADTIIFSNAPSTDAAKPPRRSVWRRLSPDSYRVTVQEQSGEAWSDRLAVTYSRLTDHAGDVLTPRCSGAEFRLLDYLIGDWDVVDTKSGNHFLYNSVQPVNGGCAVRESLRMQGDVPGTSLNFYSPTDKRWHAFYHSPTLHAVLEGTTGPDGRNTLETRAVLPGERQPSLVRQITSRDARGRPHQLGLAIAKDGKTRVLWDLTFCPRAPGAERSAPCDKAPAVASVR